jgi:hypothetical protein
LFFVLSSDTLYQTALQLDHEAVMTVKKFRGGVAANAQVKSGKGRVRLLHAGAGSRVDGNGKHPVYWSF